MTYLFYAAVCLALAVFETTLMADLVILQDMYDLLIPFVVYLGLYRPVKESLPVIVCLGFVMDNLSGAPFGLYLTAYIWVFAGIKWGMRYLRVRTSALVMFVVPLAVFVELVLSMTVLMMGASGGVAAPLVSRRLGGQLFWALLTGPLFLMFYEVVHDRLEKWTAERKAERNGFFNGRIQR
jgi:rod shape-determining protein MreD